MRNDGSALSVFNDGGQSWFLETHFRGLSGLERLLDGHIDVTSCVF